jgi:hypothetical protein
MFMRVRNFSAEVGFKARPWGGLDTGQKRKVARLRLWRVAPQTLLGMTMALRMDGITVCNERRC